RPAERQPEQLGRADEGPPREDNGETTRHAREDASVEPRVVGRDEARVRQARREPRDEGSAVGRCGDILRVYAMHVGEAKLDVGWRANETSTDGADVTPVDLRDRERTSTPCFFARGLEVERDEAESSWRVVERGSHGSA